MYKQGGLFSVTSRILVADMLTNKIPVDLITGIVVLHAELYVVASCPSPGRQTADYEFFLAASRQLLSRPSSFESTAKRTEFVCSQLSLLNVLLTRSFTLTGRISQSLLRRTRTFHLRSLTTSNRPNATKDSRSNHHSSVRRLTCSFPPATYSLPYSGL